MSEGTNKNSSEQDGDSECKVSVSSESKNYDPEEDFPETPYTRKNMGPEPNMFDKGLTEDDNKMIQLTMAFHSPMRLN